jgi:7-cyano-7-deazaguanine synthase in queuosine biosynthesis
MSSTGRIADELSGKAMDVDIGRNLSLNEAALADLGALDSLDSDLLRVAAYLYAADLAIKRHEREQHIRSISVQVPVVNLHAFERVHSLVEEALTTLSRDNWSIVFTALTPGHSAPIRQWPKKRACTLLFSGGLDSFAGAVHLLGLHKDLTLVSHVTHNHPLEAAQTELARALCAFAHQPIKHVSVRVFGRNHRGMAFPADQEREESQRTRSFLFTSLAAVAARLNGARRIVVMAENGQFAIHLPLSEARVGSFSTHTAHPRFLAIMEQILRELFICEDLELRNPFVHYTKGEVVGLLPEELRRYIPRSISCWRASRMPASRTHCGVCIPCLCRRIATERHGIKIREFERDLLREDIGGLDDSDLGKRNLVDLCQFATVFSGPSKLSSDEELCLEFPELLDPYIDKTEAIAMYRRFADEALHVFGRYSRVKAILK